MAAFQAEAFEAPSQVSHLSGAKAALDLSSQDLHRVVADLASGNDAAEAEAGGPILC